MGAGQKKNVFSDLINSLSYGKFFKNMPNIVATRDYLSVKLWDIRNPGTHLSNIAVCDYLEKNLCNLYEEDSIYDKFFLDVSPCNNYVMTGAYNKNGHIIDINAGSNVTVHANFN